MQQNILATHEYRLLIGAVLDKSPEWVFMHLPNVDMSKEQKQELDGYVKRRLEGEPIAKILGYKEFYGRRFYTNAHTLDPRPDSETLIDAVLANAAFEEPLLVLDLGLGTGCLLLTLLAERPNALGLGVDYSHDALKMAQKNQRNLGLTQLSLIFQSDWSTAIKGNFDIIVSNPPYIGTGEELDTSTLYDPTMALFSGVSGLEAYEKIVPQIPRLLKPNGRLYLEIGKAQELCVEKIAFRAGLRQVGAFRDLSGTIRVLCYSANNKKT